MTQGKYRDKLGINYKTKYKIDSMMHLNLILKYLTEFSIKGIIKEEEMNKEKENINKQQIMITIEEIMINLMNQIITKEAIEVGINITQREYSH